MLTLDRENDARANLRVRFRSRPRRRRVTNAPPRRVFVRWCIMSLARVSTSIATQPSKKLDPTRLSPRTGVASTPSTNLDRLRPLFLAGSV